MASTDIKTWSACYYYYMYESKQHVTTLAKKVETTEIFTSLNKIKLREGTSTLFDHVIQCDFDIGW